MASASPATSANTMVECPSEKKKPDSHRPLPLLLGASAWCCRSRRCGRRRTRVAGRTGTPSAPIRPAAGSEPSSTRNRPHPTTCSTAIAAPNPASRSRSSRDIARVWRPVVEVADIVLNATCRADEPVDRGHRYVAPVELGDARAGDHDVPRDGGIADPQGVAARLDLVEDGGVRGPRVDRSIEHVLVRTIAISPRGADLDLGSVKFSGGCRRRGHRRRSPISSTTCSGCERSA